MVFQDPFGSLNPVHRVDISWSVPSGCTARPGRRTHLRSGSEELMDDGRPARRHARLPRLRALRRPAPARRHRPRAGRGTRSHPRRRTHLHARRVRPDRRPQPDAPTPGRAGISMLYITHDLASARYVADRTTVMFAGELVESGDSLALMDQPGPPLHPAAAVGRPRPRPGRHLRPRRTGPAQRAAVLRRRRPALSTATRTSPCSRTDAGPPPRRAIRRPALGALPPLPARCGRRVPGPGRGHGRPGGRRRTLTRPGHRSSAEARGLARHGPSAPSPIIRPDRTTTSGLP